VVACAVNIPQTVLANDIFNVGHEIRPLFSTGGVPGRLQNSYEHIQTSFECIESDDDEFCEEEIANADFLDWSGANAPATRGIKSPIAKKAAIFRNFMFARAIRVSDARREIETPGH
jgi:hypothetical protein